MGLLLTKAIDTIQDRGRECVAVVCERVVVGACPIRPALFVACIVPCLVPIEAAVTVNVHMLLLTISVPNHSIPAVHCVSLLLVAVWNTAAFLFAHRAAIAQFHALCAALGPPVVLNLQETCIANPGDLVVQELLIGGIELRAWTHYYLCVVEEIHTPEREPTDRTSGVRDGCVRGRS